jgi:hypothetical protein
VQLERAVRLLRERLGLPVTPTPAPPAPSPPPAPPRR